MTDDPTDPVDVEHEPVPPRRWRRRHPVIAGVVALAAISTGAVVVGFALQPAAPRTKPPAELALPDLADASMTRTLRDPNRVVLLNLFASWCVPCRRELPALQAAHVAHPQVAFVGVDHLDSRRAALALLAETGVTYPAVYDPTGWAAAAYAARGMPTTVILRPDGTVAAQHTGELDTAGIQHLLDQAGPP